MLSAAPTSKSIILDDIIEQLDINDRPRLAAADRRDSAYCSTAEDSQIEVTYFSSPSKDEIAPKPPISVAVIGCGYIGLHLIESFSSQYRVCGFDLDKDRIQLLTRTFEDREINARLSSDTRDIKEANVYLISVPTLLQKETQEIDTSHLRSAVKSIAEFAVAGDLVVIESSVAVGMTREYLFPLHRKGVLCGMSPERADPGRVRPLYQDIPKVVAGLDAKSSVFIQAVYERIFTKVVVVSSVEAAEMTKLYENCYRMINIQFVNEIADLCEDFNLDPYEIVDAASTKPFGYHRFTPSIGVGGHCIPVNPYYLFHNAKRSRLPLLRRATDDAWSRPIQMGQNFINSYGNMVRMCLVGLGFKAGEGSISCSPQILYARKLIAEGVNVVYFDRLVTQKMVPDIQKLDDKDWHASYLENHIDIVVVALFHDTLDASILRTLCKTETKWFCQKPEAYYRNRPSIHV